MKGHLTGIAEYPVQSLFFRFKTDSNSVDTEDNENN